MKRIVPFLAALILTLSMPSAIFADNTQQQNKTESDVNSSEQIFGENVRITVVVPSEKDVSKEKEKIKEQEKKFPKLYPVSVYESAENGVKQIIKTYELSESEKPEDIPCDSFQKGDFDYELTDIIKKETASADVKEHTKTVSLNTDTNDLNAIVKQLAQTVEYKSDDGYAGILSLDIKSIKVETAGTKTSNYTVSAVREYPNLSSNDTALIPKTITDNGRTMNIAGIEWRTQTSSSVDYQELPTTYTAVVSYTAAGSKTIVTGYAVTAEYKGSISKMITGKTVYTAIFDGRKILTVNDEDNQENTKTFTDSTVETTEESLIVSENIKGGGAESKKLTGIFIAFAILFSALGGSIGGAFLLLRKRHKSGEETAINEESSVLLEDEQKGESKK